MGESTNYIYMSINSTLHKATIELNTKDVNWASTLTGDDKERKNENELDTSKYD